MAERELPFPESLCHRCAALRLLPAARSSFLLCSAGPDRYPRQPVVTCALYRPADATTEGAGRDRDGQGTE